MTTRVQLLYDFEGDPDNGELDLREGDIVTVLNKDIGDGWWEAETADGVVGLFPESYCEVLDDGGGGGEEEGEGGGGDYQPEYQPEPEEQSTQKYAAGEPDEYEWDDQDEWDDQEFTGSGAAATPSYSPQDGYSADRSASATPRNYSSNNENIASATHGYVKKDLNRFSAYVKTGTESYMLRNLTVKRKVRDAEKIRVILSRDDECPIWEPNDNPFTVEVKDPEKKKKFKGVVSFVAYQVIPSSTNQAVSRRYKHYDWLHDRLVEKFTLLSIPPLPDKTFQSRYGEEFVEKRKEKLQMWTNRVARHPILSRSAVFQHFLTCPDSDQGDWKAGKRKAEKDEMIGGAFLLTVDTELTVSAQQIDAQMEGFGQFRKSMEENCVKLRDRMQIHCNSMSGPIMQEWHRMANVIHGLGQCFQQENKEYAKGLNAAIECTAETYRDIGTMHSQQPKKDTLPALDVLKEYLGILHEFPDTTDIHRRSLSKIRECERMKEEGRIDIMEAGEIQGRSEKVAAVLQSEMYHFHRERVIDFRQMMREMLQEQISFYKEITAKLENSLEMYNEETNL